MKPLAIPFLPLAGGSAPIGAVSAALDELPRIPIEAVSWPAYSYKPAVSVALAHCGDWLLLKYYVREKEVRARYRRTHDPVYRDSCVELFLAFDQDQAYYNLEFNSLGTCRAGFGPGRENRRLVPAALVANIRRLPQRQAPLAGHDTAWQLTLMIPAAVFWQHDIVSFRGLAGRGNFFKCGDDLAEPHFLSWQAISAAKPNFHLPAFFGALSFA